MSAANEFSQFDEVAMKSPGPLNRGTAIHHGRKARIECAHIGRIIHDTQLQPCAMHPSRNRFVDDRTNAGAVDEAIHDRTRKARFTRIMNDCCACVRHR